MKIIGYKRSDFTSSGKDSTLITGFSLYLAYPVSGEEADGMACERYYMTDAKLAKCGYKPHVGDEVNISFNRYGKPDFITLVK